MSTEIKRALKGQYHAGLAMLRQAFERCPEEVWTSGAHPRHPWRIAYHALFYTHLYLMTHEAAFQAFGNHRPSARVLWDDDDEDTPVLEPYTISESLAYADHLDANLDAWVDAIDLDSRESGFSWYSIPKLDHQILNIRHLQGHVGQLSEHLFAANVDLDWISSR